LVTDVDINYVHIAALNASVDDLATIDERKAERDAFLLKRHTSFDQMTEDSDFDVNRIFELNLAHDLAVEQKKVLTFIDEEDDIDDLLFKHHTMLRRIQWNFEKFIEQLTKEADFEVEFERQSMSVAYMQSSHTELENLYSTAEDLKTHLTDLLGESRTTIDHIFARNSEIQKKDAAPGKGSFESS